MRTRKSTGHYPGRLLFRPDTVFCRPFRQSLLVLESCANERCIRNRNGLVSEQLGLLGTDIPRGMRDLHSGIHEPSGNGKFGTRICFKFQW